MKSKFIIYSILGLFPFIFLSPFTFKFLEVGNDFELYFFVYKKYIFELIINGHLPFWSPVEASGYSLIFNPLAQFVYLPSWIFYFISYLNGELTKYSFLIYTIVAISIFNIGLFNFLKSLKINTNVAVVSVLIICMSLKINELLRLPNAIHTFAWFPWILYGINLNLLKDNFTKSFIIISASTLMILTAGYPYYIFYGILLFSTYFIFINLFKKSILIDYNYNNFTNLFQSFYRSLIPAIFGFLIPLPWLLKVNQLMSITKGRDINDISFSYSMNSSFIDQVGSWIYPPYSIAEGWYYTGAFSVFIILLFSILRIFNKDYNKNGFISFILFFIFLFFLTFQFSNPKNSIIFGFVWNNLDFIQNFRNWIRINIIFIPILSVILAYSLEYLINLIQNENKKKLYILTSISLFLLIISLQIYFINFSDFDNKYWETWQLKRISTAEERLPYVLGEFINLYNNYIYSIFTATCFILISFLIFKKKKLNSAKSANFYVLNLILILSFIELFPLSNLQWAIPYNYYNKGFESMNLEANYNSHNENALKDLENSFLISRTALEKSGNENFEGNTYYRNNKKSNINYINNWGNKNHAKLFDKFFYRNGNLKDDLSEENKQSTNYFFGIDNESRKFFYSSTINHADIKSYVKDSISSEKDGDFKYTIIKYNGDNFEINIDVKNKGWFSFIDTWDPNWKAYVNYKEVTIKKLFDAYKTIEVNEGQNKIKFIYEPINLNFKN